MQGTNSKCNGWFFENELLCEHTVLKINKSANKKILMKSNLRTEWSSKAKIT